MYNYLNLPQTIEFTNSRRIEFIYDATGMKLRKTTYENGVVKESREYMDGFEYVNDKIERIHHAEGVITQRAKRADEGTEFVGAGGLVWQYEYTLKDHLGNTRVTFADIDGDRKIDPNTEINQINHYYPFGLNMEGNWNGASADAKNKYQFGGKELQSDFGLDLNDFGARMYDPNIGRWLSPDPLAEKFMKWSPYNYTLDNPIGNIDPDGRDVIVKTKNNRTTITYNGVLKDGTGTYTSQEMKQMRADIRNQLKQSFSGKSGSQSWKIKVNLRLETESKKTNGTENTITLANTGATLSNGKTLSAYEAGTSVGGFDAYINVGVTTNIAKTGTHEVGHNMGLPHTFSLVKDANGKNDAFTSANTNLITKDNPLIGNLMTPGTYPSSLQGETILPSQINHIQSDYDNGLLNRTDVSGGQTDWGSLKTDVPVYQFITIGILDRFFKNSNPTQELRKTQ